MGCCSSKYDHQNQQSEWMPHEECIIERAEGSEIYASLVQKINTIQVDATEIQENVSQNFSLLPGQTSSVFENSSFKYQVALALTSSGTAEQRGISILDLCSKDVFSYEDINKLVEDIIEISARILPFMVYHSKRLNEYSFHYYISTLAKGKQTFRRSCLFDIMGTELRIEKSELLQKLVGSPLMSTHTTRVEIWKLKNKKKCSSDDFTIQSSLTPRTMHRTSIDNIY